MEEKTAILAARTTRAKHKIVHAVAAMDGRTVSQWIEEDIVKKAVQRLQPAEVQDAD